ncbi:substrate-binding periplasmic protein [Hahella ganghwensis]|uniref:substrate-binding periplasmic protein n=1 Tax=Hahella ganghwensis TaxID=286420 RepID=UPI00035EDCED|nr:transporter substrate-binding domain-containing protein [Hahella ganghwensis]
MWRLIFTLILTFFLGQPSCYAEERLALASALLPPYVYEESGHAKGVAVDIVRAALNEEGITLSIVIVPPNRAINMLGGKQVAGFFPILKNDDRSMFLHFSQPLAYYQMTLFTRGTGITSFEALKHDNKTYKIGLSQNYIFPEEFQFLLDPDRHDPMYLTSRLPIELLHLRMLASGRTDITIMDESIGDYFIHQHKKELADIRKIPGARVPQLPIFLGLLKALPESESTITRFNQGLSKLFNSPRIHEIYQRYGVDSPK